MYHSSDGESGGVEKTTWEKYYNFVHFAIDYEGGTFHMCRL